MTIKPVNVIIKLIATLEESKMSFEETLEIQTLEITTIDPPNTYRREDGFCIDLKSGIICIASIIPDFNTANTLEVERALEKGTVPKEIYRKNYFFTNERGFTQDLVREAIIVQIEPPYMYATVGLGNARIKNLLTHDQADHLLAIDKEFQSLMLLAERDEEKPINSMGLVDLFLFKFNSICTGFMLKTKTPFLGKKGIHPYVNNGLCIVNNPLRNPVAFINCLQLASFLRGDGIRFSLEELNEICEKYGKTP